VTGLEQAVAEIRSAMSLGDCSLDEHARGIQQELIPAMERARACCDAIESRVSADLWPMPTYTDLLFD
jgi:glutamine synthetase type III